MSVLSRTEIDRRRALCADNTEGLVVTPLHYDGTTGEPTGLDSDSIDLRLGARFLLPRGYYCECLSFPDDGPTEYYKAVESVHIPPNKEIIIPAHGTVLGATLEYLKLPYDVSGQVLTRSSLARRFITIATAPWIHPLYRGCLTLEIANASNTPIKLRPGVAIGQLVLFLLSDAKRPPSDRIEGDYFGPTYVELPIATPGGDVEPGV